MSQHQAHLPAEAASGYGDDPSAATRSPGSREKRARSDDRGNGQGGRSAGGVNGGSSSRQQRRGRHPGSGGDGETRVSKSRKKTSSRPDESPFQFDLDPSRLLFVDSLESLNAAREILNRAVLLGIDTETQPSFKVGEWHPTSLLQMGTRDARGEENVIVVDLLAFEDRLQLPTAVLDALRRPFESSSVMKVGVGLDDDFEQLAFAYEGIPFVTTIPRVLGLSEVHARWMGAPTRLLPSLRKLAEFHLGKTMSKRWQTSSWRKRPLKGAQLEYAACDALVPLRVYDALSSKVGREKVNELASSWSPKPVPERGTKRFVKHDRTTKSRAAAVGRRHIVDTSEPRRREESSDESRNARSKRRRQSGRDKESGSSVGQMSSSVAGIG